LLVIWRPVTSGISFAAIYAIDTFLRTNHFPINDIIENTVPYLKGLSFTQKPLIQAFRDTLLDSGRIDFFGLELANLVLFLLSSFVRLVVAFVFVGSFLVKPVLMKPISHIWLRIIESDRPVFTMIFGGISSAAVGLDELLKYV
jgi:hypothetical protein